ncbi:hypothetical protein G3G6_059 [Escherichia phage vB_EcoM-G3G6]|nr:hypothetical protein CHD2BS1_059 [Escherichia phage vB_EcoM-CHD2BS1]QZI80706.1 hypothetical protein CHD16UKE1_059 [Escherichia phage vB_EcoM-CHD16UKE1]QZI81446.1 hypothetical protein G3F6_059 [Escherichia phage vB_EcoM-G3F6]QZI82026.1 hypothetical protein G3F8_059 [Escherichia phage vB_EcoM-G3F8]QZI82316.1 hypothetical protein G3F9_059 [Escherichia phage vB_EcoM-G3F9]QZI82895.1 hypothetical protein G3G6_059 [Escherichia phage vB_EcoM-G3G6]QZI83185.1 hypothetical protein G3G7_059 [Escherich
MLGPLLFITGLGIFTAVSLAGLYLYDLYESKKSKSKC